LLSVIKQANTSRLLIAYFDDRSMAKMVFTDKIGELYGFAFSLDIEDDKLDTVKTKLKELGYAVIHQ